MKSHCCVLQDISAVFKTFPIWVSTCSMYFLPQVRVANRKIPRNSEVQWNKHGFRVIQTWISVWSKSDFSDPKNYVIHISWVWGLNEVVYKTMVTYFYNLELFWGGNNILLGNQLCQHIRRQLYIWKQYDAFLNVYRDFLLVSAVWV